MKTFVIYDSVYGNTEKVAQAIGGVLPGEVQVLPVSTVNTVEIKSLTRLIVGSPVHGGRPTPAIDTFLKKIPTNSLKGIKVTAFDTRFAPEDHGIGLRILMKIIRFASPRIAKTLQNKGGTLVAEPEGFIVEDKAGPLKKGELERATLWAKGLKLAI